MGAEEEGGGRGGRGVLQPLFLLYSLNLGCVDRLGVGAGRDPADYCYEALQLAL